MKQWFTTLWGQGKGIVRWIRKQFLTNPREFLVVTIVVVALSWITFETYRVGNLWDDFSTNFLSDLITGVILAAFVAYYLNRREKRSEARSEELAKVKRRGLYLQFLKKEIDWLLIKLPELKEEFDGTGYGKMFHIQTAYWEVLEHSGELPKFIAPEILESLVIFYAHLLYAKRTIDTLVYYWSIPNHQSVPGYDEKLKALVDATSSSFAQALNVGAVLPGAIGEEHTKLKQQMEELKRNLV